MLKLTTPGKQTSIVILVRTTVGLVAVPSAVNHFSHFLDIFFCHRLIKNAVFPSGCNIWMITSFAYLQHVGVSINGGTPSHHPFLDGILPHKPSSYGGTPMAMETLMCGCKVRMTQ